MCISAEKTAVQLCKHCFTVFHTAVGLSAHHAARVKKHLAAVKKQVTGKPADVTGSADGELLSDVNKRHPEISRGTVD